MYMVLFLLLKHLFSIILIFLAFSEIYKILKIDKSDKLQPVHFCHATVFISRGRQQRQVSGVFHSSDSLRTLSFTPAGRQIKQ
jgi:hypothetical protein